VSARPAWLAAIAAVVVSLSAALSAGAAKQSGPPPTPVPPRGSLSPYPSVLATPADPTRPPHIAARGALLADLDTGQILFAQRPRTPRPIASVTKLLTALLARDALPLHRALQVDPRAEFERDDFGASSTVGLRAGERIDVEDLLYGLLLGSANDAALELAIAVDGSEAAFVAHMNARAAALGMTETRVASASGLDDDGRSTPRDLLTLARAVEQDRILRAIVDTRFHRIASRHGPDRIVQNRNALLWLDGSATGMKTGTTAGAGACVVATASRDGRHLVAIVLGADREAFSPAAALLNYGFDGWRTDTVVPAGASAGVVAIRGGTVPVVAARDLTRLVPVRSGDRTQRVAVDPRAAFPPAPRDRVATLVVRDGGTVLGSVPLIVPDVPPPPPSEGPWWARAAGAIGGAVVDAVGALAA
jgi:serine-type D-Ala-D-Ala carboxypeptidase (penicillin-binding protein 5/6)